MNRLMALIVTGLVIVSIAGVVVTARLSAGSEIPTLVEGAAQEATPSPTETPTPVETATGTDLAAVRVTQYEVFISRDPFEPVIISTGGTTNPDGSPTADPTTAPTGDPTGTPTTSPTGTPTTSPTSSPTPTPTTSPSPGSTPSPAPGDEGCVDTGTVVCDGQVVKLVDVFDDGRPGAVVQVDGTAYEVRSGDVFAANYQVRSIESPCATILYGDDAFTLCEGESTLK